MRRVISDFSRVTISPLHLADPPAAAGLEGAVGF
jgi:hypothetical protein